MMSAQVQKKQNRFLAAFEKTGTILQAARKCNVSRRAVYYWRAHDKEFEAKFLALELDVTSFLEDATMDDALGVWHAKKQRYVGGDSILKIFLLKSRNPTKYRDNTKIELAGSVATTPGIPALAEMSKAELLALAGIKA